MNVSISLAVGLHSYDPQNKATQVSIAQNMNMLGIFTVLETKTSDNFSQGFLLSFFSMIKVEDNLRRKFYLLPPKWSFPVDKEELVSGIPENF